MQRNKLLLVFVSLIVLIGLAGCSTPQEKAQKFYDKGMTLLDTDPGKAKLEFQNALQMKKDMTEAIYGLALVAEKQSEWKTCYALLNQVLDAQPKHVDAIIKIGQLFLAAGELEKAKERANYASQISPENAGVLLLNASIALKENDLKSAIAKANQVLQKDNRNADAYLLLASASNTQKNIPEALGFLEKGLAINQKNLALQLFKISLLSQSGQKDQAEKTYQQVVEMYPAEMSLREKFAEFLLQSGKKEAAEQQLRYLVDNNPKELAPKLNLVKFLLQVKGPKEGRAEFEKMVKLNPNDYDLSFSLVELYESQQDNSASEALLNHIVTTAGSNNDGLKAKTKVATKLLQQNQNEQAKKLIGEVLAQDKGFTDALILKSAIAINDAQYDAAILDLRSVLKDKPNSAQALFLLAKAYEQTGSTSLAEESYTKALDVSKFSPTFAIPYVQSLMNDKKLDRAEKVLQEVIRKYPNNIAVTKLLVDLKLETGDVDGAQKIANSIKNASNSNLSDLIEGAVSIRKNDFATSLAAFQRAYQKSPNDMQAVNAIVKIHLNRKNFNEAQTFLESVVAANPANYQARILLAEVYDQAGNRSKAFETFESIIVSAPKEPAAYQQYAVANIRAKDINKAKEIIEKGLVVNPNNYDLEMALAEVYQYQKAYTEALGVYEKLLKINPSSLIAVNNYVSIVSDYVSDAATIERAYTLAQPLKNSQVPQFLDTAGWISYRAGKYDEAIQQLELAVAKSPNDGATYYHLGKAYLAKQDKAKAKVNLEKALSISKTQNLEYTNEIKTLLKSV